LPADGVGSLAFWQDEVDRATTRRKRELRNWRTNLDRYLGKRIKVALIRDRDFVQVNSDFVNIETKRSQLFFQTPHVDVAAARKDVSDQTASLFEQIINWYVGPHGVDALTTVEEAIFDVLCPAGIGATKIGYEASVEQVPIDTGTLGPDGQPTQAPITRTIWSRFYWDHISADALLLPKGFRGQRYDDAPWIGWNFEWDPDQFRRETGRDGGGDETSPSDHIAARPSMIRRRRIPSGSAGWCWSMRGVTVPTGPWCMKICLGKRSTRSAAGWADCGAIRFTRSPFAP
jgi:hypothetical protein